LVTFWPTLPHQIIQPKFNLFFLVRNFTKMQKMKNENENFVSIFLVSEIFFAKF